MWGRAFLDNMRTNTTGANTSSNNPPQPSVELDDDEDDMDDDERPLFTEDSPAANTRQRLRRSQGTRIQLMPMSFGMPHPPGANNQGHPLDSYVQKKYIYIYIYYIIIKYHISN